MKKKEIIPHSLITAYCLEQTNSDENDYIEGLALLYPQLRESIEQMKAALKQPGTTEIVPPRPFVKHSLMRKIYRQQSAVDKKFIPLMDECPDFKSFHQSAKANLLKDPGSNFENLYALPLPSTREVINMAVWIKNDHEEEVHTDAKEYIAILRGSCDMYIDGVETAYEAGQVVSIPLNVPHFGIVTSADPMFALVQRQVV